MLGWTIWKGAYVENKKATAKRYFLIGSTQYFALMDIQRM